jgi:hypothetical protein
MAKSTVKQDQAAASAEFDKLAKIQREWDKLLEKKKAGRKYDEERLTQLEQEYKQYGRVANKVDKLADTYNILNKKVEDHNKKLGDSVENYDDMEDALTSIGNRMGKNSDIYAGINKKIETSKKALDQVSSILQGQNQLNERQEATILKAAESYKGFLVDISEASKKQSQGNLTQEQYNHAIKDSYESLTGMVDMIDDSTEAGAQLKSQFQAMAKESKSFYDASMKSLGATQKLDEIFESFHGIPALGEINTLLKTNIKDTLAFKAAVFALGAALGKAAFDYFGAPIKAAMQAHKEIAQNDIDSAAAVAKIRKDAESIPAQIGQERLEHEISANEEIRKLTQEAAYAGQKAAIQFSSSMQMGAAQFARAAKTALFGNKIGGIGYGAAQMQLAGIGADKVASAMEASAAATGKMPTAKAAADMAIMAERTGQSVDDISTINEAFQRMDGMSAGVAMNMQEGMRNMADQAGIGLGNLMKEVAQASKEALGYQIKSGPALAKAVAYTQSMGLNFGDVAKAGKNMVMNYKESIKAEMQLSSMLGEQVDLAEVRAKFAAGDTEGALSSLKSQGLDPADMDMFQQQALQDALGGLDLNSLSKVSQNTGKEVGLSAGNAKAGNQDFLTRTQSAESALSAQQASISAQTAIVDAELSKKIGDAYLADPGYAEYKKKQSEAAVAAEELAASMKKAWLETDEYKKSLSDTAKLNFLDTLKEGLMGGLAAAAGGLLTSGISTVAGKVFGGKGGGATPAEAAAPAAAEVAESGGGSIKEMATSALAGKADEFIPGAGGVVESLAGGGSVVDSVKGAAVGAIAGKADELIPGAGAAIEGLSGQVEAIEAPLEEAMSFGEKLKDFGKGIGSFLKSVGKGIGDAIGGILQGVSRGLAALGTPQVLLGVVTMIGLGASLFVAGKGLQEFQGLEWETIGMAFTTLLGLGAIGAILGTVSPFIITGAVAITAMSVAFAAFGLAAGVAIPNLMQFQSLDYGALTLVGGSLVVLAAGIAAFGAGAIVGAIGSFFSGGVFDDLKDISDYANPIMQTATAVEALANAFGRLSSIDVSALTKIPWGDMEDFASEGGKFVLASSGGGSFALSKESTDNIKTLAADTKANLQVSKNLQALIAVLADNGESATQVVIDGKNIATMIQRRSDNIKARNPGE